MKNLNKILYVGLLLFANSLMVFSQKTGIKVLNKINVPGDGKWDFVTFDNVSRRLYISHAKMMQVVDVDKATVVGEVPNTPGIHGIAIVTEANRGYTSNGKDSTVTVFDLKTFATIKTIKLKGSNPDHIIYERFSKKVFAFNNKSSDVSIIDPKTNTVISTIALGGFPELAVSDGKGLVYVNLEDKSEIAIIDTKHMTLKAKWSLAPGEEPTGLAFDAKNMRLFAGCANKLLVVMNAENGKVITTLPIGEKVDGVAFDAATKLIYTSNGEGTITVISQESADKYVVADNIVTKKGAKTLALDEQKHRLYLPCADYSTEVPAPTEAEPKPKAPILPSTFGILVVGK